MGSLRKSLWLTCDGVPFQLQLLPVSGVRLPVELIALHGAAVPLRTLTAALTPALRARHFQIDRDGRSNGRLTALAGAWRVRVQHLQLALDRKGKAELRSEVIAFVAERFGEAAQGRTRAAA